MEENQQAPTSLTPAQTDVSPVKKPIYKKVWFIILLCIGGLLLLFLIISFLLKGTNSNMADKFYGMVEAVAQKNKIRYAYNLNQSEISGQSGIATKSLVEYDAAAGVYSSAYASEAIVATVGRCVKGQEYRSTAEKTFPDDLKMAEEILRGPFKVSDGRFSSGACQYDKSRYNGDFTDGMLAVGVTPIQAKNMADVLRSESPAKLTDNGMTTYKGKAARKISFEVGKTLTGTAYQSDAFFYAFRDGPSPTVGANVPLDKLAKHFDDTFQVPPVGLKGFYLIDEKTNLPLYRYLETVADGQAEGFTPRTIMSEYSFPDTLTMNETTQLPELSKQ